MTSLTDVVDVVIGVDTHVHTHSAAVIDGHTGAVISAGNGRATACGQGRDVVDPAVWVDQTPRGVVADDSGVPLVQRGEERSVDHDEREVDRGPRHRADNK